MAGAKKTPKLAKKRTVHSLRPEDENKARRAHRNKMKEYEGRSSKHRTLDPNLLDLVKKLNKKPKKS